MSSDPFAVLGLPARADVTDDDVRAAWRRIAASAHPDREDGGDPGRYAEAAAAYAALRTSYDRGEALADRADRAAAGADTTERRTRALTRFARAAKPGPGTARRWGTARSWRAPVLWLLLAAAAGILAVLAAGWTPGTIAVLTGELTWVAATAWRVCRNQRAARQGG
jgi:curved DNA-binding protein CbpA